VYIERDFYDPREDVTRMLQGNGSRHSRGILVLVSVGPAADPGVQEVNPQAVGGRLPLVSARPAIISVAFTRWRRMRHGSTHPIPAYYSLIDFERMKG